VIEAYAAGVPVIATALGALPEMIEHDVTGMLVPVGSAQAWIEAAGALSEDQNSARLGEGALGRWARVHGPQKALLELERAYQSALRA
jgi:glycosyltransferase involved in cell wall biosynthesis